MMNKTFDEVENTTLRTWNRCAMAYNIKKDRGEEACSNYLSQFNDRSKRQMAIMFEYINLKGYEEVKREVFRGVNS